MHQILDYGREPCNPMHRWGPVASVVFAVVPWLTFYAALLFDLDEDEMAARVVRAVIGLALLWLPFACNVVIWLSIRRSSVSVVRRRVVLISFVWSLLTALVLLAALVRVPKA